MKKKIKITLWISLISVLILIGVFFVVKNGVLNASLGGYSVLGISKADVIQDGKLGESWLVSISTIPNAFSITGKIASSDVADKSGDVPVSDFDVYIGVDQTLQYPITATSQFLYDYSIRKVDVGLTECVLDNGVTPSDAFLSSWVKDSFSVTCKRYDVVRVANGKIGNLATKPAIPSLITIQVSANGKESSVTTLDTSKSSGSNDLFVNGKNLGRVDYGGDLINSAQFVPELDKKYKPINKGGEWFFVSLNNFNVYNNVESGSFNTDQNEIASCLGTQRKLSGFSQSTALNYFGSCISSRHDAYNSLQKVSVSELSLKEITVDSKSQIFATFSADKLYSFPQLTFLLSTEWVGLKVNSGKPKIVSMETSSCSSGSRGILTAVVKNVGNGLGAFDASLSCDSSVSVLTSNQVNNYIAGESKTLKYNFDMNVDKVTKKSCILKVTDKGSFESVTGDISVSCSPASICVPNEEYCNGNNKMICNAGGTAFVVKQGDVSCQNNQSGGITCSDQAFGLVKASLGVKQECSFFCKISITKPKAVNTCVYDYTLVWIIAGFLLVALFIFMVTRNKGKGGRKGGQNALSGIEPKYWFIIAGVVAVLIMYFFFFAYFFWGAIILAILFIIAKKLKVI